MGLRSLGVCVVFILCTGWQCTRAASVTMTSTLGVKGVRGHQIVCRYTLLSGEGLRNLDIYRGSDQLVSMVSIDTSAVWDPGFAQSSDPLLTRATLSGSLSSQDVTIALRDTLCSDEGVQFKCELKFNTAGSSQDQREDSTTVQIEAPPQTPAFTFTQNTDSVQEFTMLDFECSGNVGLPAGTFQWYTFFGDDYVNVTDQATQGSSVPDTGEDSCTFRRISTFRYNATRTQDNKKLVVRCLVYHATQGSNNIPGDCGANDTYCRQSQQINILYPVSVSVSDNMLTVVEGDGATLTCTAVSNPTAFGTMWYKDDVSNMLANGTVLQLSDLTLNDTGSYTCISFNEINGVTYNSTASTSLTVDEKPPPTTTPEPTTPPATTPGGGGGGNGGGGESSPSKADVGLIVGIVVGVAVVVVIIIIILVVCLRKRRSGKEVEEPPEKPFNNHAGINTVATRPDLVNNDKIYPSGFSNVGGFKNEDGLTYAELQFDNKPRSRRPLALDDTNTDYSDVSMPAV